MTAQIEFSPAAVREYKKLNSREKTSILKEIEKLAEEPFPKGHKKLSGISRKVKNKLGTDCIYRIRVDTFRVLYSVDDGKITVCILRIGARKEVYQFLKSGQV